MIKIINCKEEQLIDTKSGAAKIVKVHNNGMKFCWRFNFSNDFYLIATQDHLVYNHSKSEFIELGDFEPGDIAIYKMENNQENLYKCTFLGKEEYGFKEVFDLTVDSYIKTEKSNYFINSNPEIKGGILVSNCSYSLFGYITAFWKVKKPAEFIVSSINAFSDNKEKMESAISECPSLGIEILTPKWNQVSAKTKKINSHKILLGLELVDKFTRQSAAVIEEICSKGLDLKETFLEIENYKKATFRAGKATEVKMFNIGHLEMLIKIGFFGNNIKEIGKKFNETRIKKEKDYRNFSQALKTGQNEGFGFDISSTLFIQKALNKFPKCGVVKNFKSGVSKRGFEWKRVEIVSKSGSAEGFVKGEFKTKPILRGDIFEFEDDSDIDGSICLYNRIANINFSKGEDKNE